MLLYSGNVFIFIIKNKESEMLENNENWNKPFYD